ncbi:hypothetical protein QJS10_CPA09g00078 [Acorus calamus]|uniref:Uncharacterized protein n=1 Tax=Acorus calamus TaxID=4465 RepID=A0AAV9E681_ACOCL|nr:hypothetical protein QJS10_CPA09g00078 [Acorus calamus]
MVLAALERGKGYVMKRLVRWILNWVQNKLSGRQEKKQIDDAGFAPHHVLPDMRKEEFSDWPQGLLAIGTFGNAEIREDSTRQYQPEEVVIKQEIIDCTLEEVVKLRKELTKMLARKPILDDVELESIIGGERPNNLPLDKFLNCPSSLEVDRIDRINADGDNSCNGVVLSRGKDAVSGGGGDNLMRRRSVSFLLEKVFACRGGFEAVPASLRDPLPESRMERFMRALLHKKIYPQSSSPRSTGKKYLEGKAKEEKDVIDDDKMRRSSSSCDGSKWVKTDSECKYIRLNICIGHTFTLRYNKN